MAWCARTSRVLVAGALLVGAAACGGGDSADEAAPASSAEASVEASAESSQEPATGPPAPAMGELPTAPPLPKAASEDSAEGAQAFARHWIALANVATLTGDIDDLDEYSAASCTACSAFISRVGTVYASGGHLMGGQISVADTSAEEPATDKPTPVAFEVTIAAQEAMSAAGEVVQKYGADKHDFTFSLEHRGGSWLVTDLKIESVA